MGNLKDEKKRKARKPILMALAAGATLTEAADSAGISSSTIYRWCDADPELASAVAEAKSRADDRVENVAFRNCIDPDPAHNTLRIFWLKCRRPGVYRDIQRTEFSGPDGGALRVRVEYADDDDHDDPHREAAPPPPGPAGDPPPGEAL